MEADRTRRPAEQDGTVQRRQRSRGISESGRHLPGPREGTVHQAQRLCLRHGAGRLLPRGTGQGQGRRRARVLGTERAAQMMRGGWLEAEYAEHHVFVLTPLNSRRRRTSAPRCCGGSTHAMKNVARHWSTLDHWISNRTFTTPSSVGATLSTVMVAAPMNG